jgi:hypothetical protein
MSVVQQSEHRGGRIHLRVSFGRECIWAQHSNDWVGLQPDAMPVAAADCRARSYTLSVSQESILREEWDVGAGYCGVIRVEVISFDFVIILHIPHCYLTTPLIMARRTGET